MLDAISFYQIGIKLIEK